MTQLDNDSKFTEIMILSSTFAWTFTFICMVCEPGDHVTNQFDAFGRKIERCDWHLLPIHLRRLYFIFLLDSQHPINIQCYGGILCTRDTLKKVKFHLIYFDKKQ